MKEYRIIKTFKGSQHGYDQPKEFVKGTTALLSDTLAAAAIAAGEAEAFAADQGAPKDTGNRDLSKLNVKKLQAELTELGVPFETDDNKARLIELLEMALESQAADQGAPEVKALAGAPENKA